MIATMATTYQFGKVTITQQSLLILLAGAVLSIGILVGSLAVGKNNTVRGIGTVVAILAFGVSCYEAYIVNCTIVGQCTVLSWVLTGLFSFGFAAFGLTFTTMLRLKPNELKAALLEKLRR